MSNLLIGDALNELEEDIDFLEPKNDHHSFNDLEGMKEIPFDYYQLVLQWQPATCSAAICLRPFSSRFSINGLWAGSYSRLIGRCIGSRFLEQNVTSIRKELDKDWPSLIISSNPAVWSEAWNLHGTCFETPTFQINDYFRLALYLFWRSDVQKALQDFGIEPINGKQYEKSYIEAAITEKFGKPALRCNLSGKYFLQSQLAQVVLCFNKCLARIDCPSQYSPALGCPTKILWLKT
ncbi:ribonuclease DdI-like [Cucumis melo var. makuwa]|uniref:Ribonuclease DdI-like n=1 Tax=Cucumis melo var. makuwa TaxID=1194695 RepID=A0A5A7TE29_CUCMM|nr:ribonuclease DdI-like [Cucumis melo var. makuwa]TYK15253.1 ribonuclease DdI-like [Cucumis melo var. makuwa]